ncbi:MAG: hypothetical protein ACLRIS_20115 [Flavonifractor plautii]
MVERYVNLGDCYDRAGLQPLRQELMGCMKGYKACYQRAYRCLTAAAQIGEDLRSLLLTRHWRPKWPNGPGHSLPGGQEGGRRGRPGGAALPGRRHVEGGIVPV